jgi:DNA-binding response OmpR family regulator
MSQTFVRYSGLTLRRPNAFHRPSPAPPETAHDAVPRLPIRVAASTIVEPMDRTSPPRDPAVLLVDDDQGIVETLADILALKGYEVARAPSGSAAVAMVRRASYGAVLMDIKMPGLNGVDAMKAMKRVDPGLPVIMMTAYSWDHLVIEAKRRTGFEVLFKPLDIERVIHVIDDCLIARAGSPVMPDMATAGRTAERADDDDDVEITFVIGGGQAVTVEEIENGVDRAMCRALQRRVERRLAGVRCLEHGQRPRLIASGPDADRLTLSAEGCCGQLIDATLARVRRLA